MRLLLDNNLPSTIAKIFSEHEFLIVKDVLSADTQDSQIFEWCRANEVAIFITKDKQFSWLIAESSSRVKCLLCTFGNLSVFATYKIFEKKKSEIEYFAQTEAKILEI